MPRISKSMKPEAQDSADCFVHIMRQDCMLSAQDLRIWGGGPGRHVLFAQ